jgi:thymidylate synthase (FAD)
MKLIKPYFEIWEQQPGIQGVFQQIERAGRVCYKSEDKITDTSAKDFVKRMIKSGHGAVLEHGTVYLVIPAGNHTVDKYKTNKYSVVVDDIKSERYLVTTNYRVLVENDWFDDLIYICESTEYHERRYTVKFVCDRGVSHEFVRHRVFSFAQESTRYCNYSKDKFGNELTFIRPCWSLVPMNPEDYNGSFLEFLHESEDLYLSLIKEGWKPQEARGILPNALKTELVMTGFQSDWKHFFELRDSGSAHPQARELAQPLHLKFRELNYV